MRRCEGKEDWTEVKRREKPKKEHKKKKRLRKSINTRIKVL